MNITPEESKRRSDLAKNLNKKGVFGGSQPGAGRPKKDRAQEHVADKIREEGESIFKALKAALNAESPTIRLKAALAMLDIETKEAEFKIKEEQRQYKNMGRDALLELIKKRIELLEGQGITVETIIGHAEEIPDPVALIGDGD